MFVHQTDLRAGTDITEGDTVEFGTADYKGREKAVDVIKVDPAPTHRRQGVCQWFDPERKHGFIKPDGASADIFVHQMDLRAGTEITQGDAVEFGTADYQGREKAVDVTKVERYAAWGVGPLPDGANPRKVSVGNIKFEASESEIKALFAAVGEMTDVQYPLDATGRPKGICFITFASAEAASRAIATMNNADFEGRKLRVGWPQFDRCQWSHNGPQVRGGGGFGDARSAAAPGDGGGYRGPRGPAPPHAPPPRCFGPTALREVVRSRLGERALRALAELETFEADAVVQSLEQAGAKVCDPTAYVCKAVDTVRRRRRESGIAPPRARLDSLQRLPPPPSGDWICGACGGNNLFWRRECFRCGTPPTMESLRHEVEANFPGLPRRRRSRSRLRERRRRRGHRS